MILPYSVRISIAANLILLLAAGYLAIYKQAQSTETAPKEASTEDPPTDTAAVPEPLRQLDYRSIQSATERRSAIVENLRALGVPNDVLALVARVDFEMQWETRFRTCNGDMNKLAAMQIEMNRCKDDEMRAALGPEGFKSWDRKYMLWEAMSTSVPVTEAEAETLYALKKKLQQLQYSLEEARYNGSMDDAGINDANNSAYADYFRQLKGLLGDERYAKSQQLDDEFLAGNLKYALSKANPTDAQVQDLYGVEKEWNRALSELSNTYQNDAASMEYQSKLKALNDKRAQEYSRILGAESFEALQKQQNPAYIQMNKYAEIWGLDNSKIDNTYEILKHYQNDCEAYINTVHQLEAQGKSIDPSAASKDLQQLEAEAVRSLTASIGQESFERLQRNRVFRFVRLQQAPGTTSNR